MQVFGHVDSDVQYFDVQNYVEILDIVTYFDA